MSMNLTKYDVYAMEIKATAKLKGQSQESNNYAYFSNKQQML